MRLKEVVYTVSPFEVSVLSGLWKDLPAKVTKRVKEVRELGVFAGTARSCVRRIYCGLESAVFAKREMQPLSTAPTA